MLCGVIRPLIEARGDRSVRWARVKALRRFTVRAHLPERLAALEKLSVNLRWSWHPATQELFSSMDPALWSALRDPLRLLGDIGPCRLEHVIAIRRKLGAHDRTKAVARARTLGLLAPSGGTT